MHPMIFIPNLLSLQIPRSPSDFSLPYWDPNLLSFVGLLVGLDCYHLFILFLFDQVWYSNLFIHLVDVGVGDFACWLLLELLLLLIPGLCLALERLVAFFVTAYKSQFRPSQPCSLPQWCYTKEVGFVWLCLSCHTRPYQGEPPLALIVHSSLQSRPNMFL
jgi:hypothetical protein